MLEHLLIKNTTKEQREQIVKKSLSVCGEACEGCSGCDGLGAGDPWDMYQPYIDGEKELDEINREYRARLVR
jgi:hypothetical protein